MASPLNVRDLATARWARWLLYGGVFTYLALVRTHNISEQFWLLGEQIRDWRIALGPFSGLPLVGTPSTAGGTTFGPVYYWVLWLIRITLGPFGNDLPHVGAVGLSLIQSAADTLLFYALAQRLKSTTLALAIVLFEATSPYDMALTATVWNPPLAVALSKITIALVLLQRDWSLGRTCAVVVFGWLSVQAHMGSIYVATACIGWMLVQPIVHKDHRRTLSAARAAIELVLLLQLPYAIEHWMHPQPGPSGAISTSIVYTAQHPTELRIAESAQALGSVMGYLLFAPHSLAWTGILLISAAIAGLVLRRRDPALSAVSIVPLVIAIVGFSAWRGRLGEHYWYLTLISPASLMLGLPISALHFRRAGYVVAAVLIAVLLIQPARCRLAWQIHRVPEYGNVVRACRQIAHQAPEIRALRAPFLPPTSDAGFIYEILGGRFSAESSLVARIRADGQVTYEAVR